jgi:hypothetical protein
MKIVLLILLLPVFSYSQTVHVKDEKIVYTGSEKVKGTSTEILKQLQDKLPVIISGYKLDEQSPSSVKARGSFRLKTPYQLIRTVDYTIQLKTRENSYEYTIDSVSFTEQERGKKPVTKTSKEMVENMGETGKIVGDTEKILNETDMRFQQIFAVIRSSVKR